MKKFLKQLFCFHPANQSQEVNNGLEAEYMITYQSPWSLFGTKETLYLCNKCGKKYYYPAGNQLEKKMNEDLLELLKLNK